MTTISTKNHFKIWFGKLPNLHKNHLIDFKRLHTDTYIKLLYDKSLLTDEEHRDLISFCMHFDIALIDLSEIHPADETEEKLLLMAKLEIKYYAEGNSGCLAAASDILRVFKECLSWGIYTDFDVTFKSKIEQAKIALGTEDVILHVINRLDDLNSASHPARYSFFVNNDLLAATPECVFITTIKQSMLESYAMLIPLDTLSVFDATDDTFITSSQIDVYWKSNITLFSHYRSRDSLLFEHIVTNTSGPGLYSQIIEEKHPEFVSKYSDGKMVLDNPAVMKHFSNESLFRNVAYVNHNLWLPATKRSVNVELNVPLLETYEVLTWEEIQLAKTDSISSMHDQLAKKTTDFGLFKNDKSDNVVPAILSVQTDLSP